MTKKTRRPKRPRPPARLRLEHTKQDWYVLIGGRNQASIEGTAAEWRALHNAIIDRRHKPPAELQALRLERGKAVHEAAEVARKTQPGQGVLIVQAPPTTAPERAELRRKMEDAESEQFFRCAARVLYDQSVELWSPRNRYRAIDIVTVEPAHVEALLAAIRQATKPPTLH